MPWVWIAVLAFGLLGTVADAADTRYDGFYRGDLLTVSDRCYSGEARLLVTDGTARLAFYVSSRGATQAYDEKQLESDGSVDFSTRFARVTGQFRGNAFRA